MPRRKRRAKGSGSVYRVKGKGWCAKRELPPIEGKRRTERRFYPTRDQALGQVSQWGQERAALAQHRQAGDTATAWFEHWLETKRGTVAPSTLEFYQRHIDYAVPHIGSLRLLDLQPQNIREALNALAALSPRSRAHVLTVLKMALQLAVDDGVITRNPCATVEAPKVERYEAYALSDDELARFYAAVADTRLAPLWHILADFGPRLEEALTLRWADYDRERHTLRVRATKTDRERYLSLAAQHIEMLDAHWGRLRGERESNPRWRENGYLFPSEVGTKLLQSNARRAFKQALERAELPPRIRVHDLRHTAATNLIAAGNDVPTVQYITGHRDSAVLLEIYAHHQDDRNREAIEKVEKRRKKGG